MKDTVAYSVDSKGRHVRTTFHGSTSTIKSQEVLPIGLRFAESQRKSRPTKNCPVVLVIERQYCRPDIVESNGLTHDELVITSRHVVPLDKLPDSCVPAVVLTPTQRAVLSTLWSNGPIGGKDIISWVRKTTGLQLSQSTLTRHVIPSLRKHYNIAKTPKGYMVTKNTPK